MLSCQALKVLVNSHSRRIFRIDHVSSTKGCRMFRVAWPMRLLARFRLPLRQWRSKEGVSEQTREFDGVRTLTTLPCWCSTVSATETVCPLAVLTRAIWNWRKNLTDLTCVRSFPPLLCALLASRNPFTRLRALTLTPASTAR